MSQKILVVDDELDIVKVVRAYLEQSGFRVITASDGQQALAAFRHEQPDLLVLDLNLPQLDGLDVCRTIRRESNVPIIMLTARVEETDRLIGLEIGADDYIVKPFSPREVVARVRTVLRRSTPVSEQPSLITLGALSIDPRKHEVQLHDRLIELTPSEFNILLALASQPGRAFSRMELLDAAQGEAYAGYERSIDVHIKNLRQKLGDEPRDPKYILTVYGVGYKFNDKVTRLA
ncbi:Alkaline phosphatase synthesis transcriptional regulatory protein PhoP [Thermoflexales bacterium]|nr:Alkaline phosphatase synthesis transcriptional regulatory protein PhoP [Thermoflexales bacterium]